MPKGKRSVPYSQDGKTFMSVKNQTVPAEVQYSSKDDEWKATKTRHLPRYEVRVPGTFGEAISYLAQKRPTSLFHPNMKRKAVQKFDEGFGRLLEILDNAGEVVEVARDKLIRTVQNTMRRNEMDTQFTFALEKVKPLDEDTLEGSREMFIENMRMVAEEEGNEVDEDELDAMFTKVKARKLKRNAEFRAEMAKAGEPVPEKEDTSRSLDDDDDDGGEDGTGTDFDGDDDDND